MKVRVLLLFFLSLFILFIVTNKEDKEVYDYYEDDIVVEYCDEFEIRCIEYEVDEYYVLYSREDVNRTWYIKFTIEEETYIYEIKSINARFRGDIYDE